MLCLIWFFSILFAQLYDSQMKSEFSVIWILIGFEDWN